MSTAESWADRLAELATRASVNGAVLGILSDGHQFVTAHGVLSTATQVPATPDSLFQIGSITKVWTATMIMQLVEAGQLSLNSTVADVLPGAQIGDPDRSPDITVQHLLTHTSGIEGDIFSDTGRGDDCVERYVDGLAHATFSHPVGEAYSYCNSGFVVLGRMIERLDERVWDASLRQRLVEPLGLSQTVTLPEEALLHRAAVGHRAHPREDEPVATWGLPRGLGPAGLITASAHDLLAFARLHLDDGRTQDGSRLLSEGSATAMRQQQLELPSPAARADAIGLAWRLSRWGDRWIVGHDGGTIGQSAFLRIDPQARIAVCLLTNAAAAEALYQPLFDEVFDAYAGISMPPVPEPAAGSPDVDLQRHLGHYERTSCRFDVFVRDGRLHLVTEPTGELAVFGELMPEEVELYPADGAGDNFVCRSHDLEPWTSVSFGTLADQTPYLFSGGRITPRVG